MKLTHDELEFLADCVGKCLAYSALGRTGSSFSPATGANHRTFTWNATIARRSSGSIPFVSRGAAVSLGRKSTVSGSWL